MFITQLPYEVENLFTLLLMVVVIVVSYQLMNKVLFSYLSVLDHSRWSSTKFGWVQVFPGLS